MSRQCVKVCRDLCDTPCEHLRCVYSSDVYMSAVQFSLLVGFTYLFIVALCCVSWYYRRKYLAAAMSETVRVEGAREPRPSPPNGAQPTSLFEDSVAWKCRGVGWLARKIDASIDSLFPPQPSNNAPTRAPIWQLGDDGDFHAQRADFHQSLPARPRLPPRSYAPASAPVRERQPADVHLQDGEVAGFIEGISPTSGQAREFIDYKTSMITD